MIDKCANPQCNERLVYLRSGVLYAVDMLSASNPQRATHFFWLCEPCSIKFTLQFDDQSEPSVVPVFTKNPPYESESESERRRVQCIFINRQRSQATDENDYVGNELKMRGQITPTIPKMHELGRTHVQVGVKYRTSA